ncbi:hypothetical protein COF68_05995 [Bacillus toyonensis]|uniref:hypothetical protein n=1 Tax=Bacillus toyonensis TaxID=155322 RepID=UPI000BFCF725|nr:hypothetical protein [Bacillus toyonensis]PHE64387.1 hypothetical protein COF68_05995 [Bacillus toyonensis]
MQCTRCGGDLDYSSVWYRGVYGREDYQERGTIYKCPNWQGFNSEEERQVYMERYDIEVGEDKEFKTIEDVICSSHDDFNGDFHTDESGELNEGYPC